MGQHKRGIPALLPLPLPSICPSWAVACRREVEATDDGEEEQTHETDGAQANAVDEIDDVPDRHQLPRESGVRGRRTMHGRREIGQRRAYEWGGGRESGGGGEGCAYPDIDTRFAKEAYLDE